jgi:hypothetical protein
MVLSGPKVERKSRIAEICPTPQFGVALGIGRWAISAGWAERRVGSFARLMTVELRREWPQYHVAGLTSIHRKIPTALADHVEKNNLQGQLKYNLFVGASSGAETENRWARLNMIERRSPHQVGKEIAKGINNGNIKFFDKHLSMFPVDLMYG